MYDDRLEILSPGKLPNIVNVNNLKHTRYSRNPKIARKVLDSLKNKGIFEWNGTSINDPKQYFEIKK